MAKTRRSPAVSDRAISTPPSDDADSSLYRRVDGYAAPDAEDRIDAAVIAAAKARGFTVAVRCTRCGQWVVAAKSVALHMGPVCRAKVAAEAVVE